MNNRQKQVQQQFLNDEKAVIKRLQQIYNKSLTDINGKIEHLTFTIGKLQQEYDWLDPDDPERARVKSMIQSKIYQKQYQEQIGKQVDGILKQMQTSNFATIAEYLDTCYTDGFVGTIFDMHGQGVPIMSPIDQEAMVNAVQLESKISKGLYTRLGEDVSLLKKKITAQVSRSIASGMTYAQTAKALEGYTRIGFNNAVRIARTEGHRVQTTATMNACYKAKEKGCDVLKQWDATLDARTRDSHAKVDGEIRELDKPFSNGLMFAGDPNGTAAEVVNCRCALLQRAKWALDDDELQTLQERASYYGLDKSEEFADFKKKYLKAVGDVPKTELDVPSYAREWCVASNVAYREIQSYDVQPSIDQIIERLGGGDMTDGSCSSLALAYCGNRQGFDVLDFRGGDSRSIFSKTSIITDILNLPDVDGHLVKDFDDYKAVTKLIQHVVEGKEYYFSTGEHASIIRKIGGKYQYLELQSPTDNGFKPLNNSVLKTRFGCKTTTKRGGKRVEKPNVLIECESLGKNREFQKLLGYINTSTLGQMKGAGGSVK